MCSKTSLQLSIQRSKCSTVERQTSCVTVYGTNVHDGGNLQLNSQKAADVYYVIAILAKSSPWWFSNCGTVVFLRLS